MQKQKVKKRSNWLISDVVSWSLLGVDHLIFPGLLSLDRSDVSKQRANCNRFGPPGRIGHAKSNKRELERATQRAWDVEAQPHILPEINKISNNFHFHFHLPNPRKFSPSFSHFLMPNPKIFLHFPPIQTPTQPKSHSCILNTKI